jgi:hypothetical protein
MALTSAEKSARYKAKDPEAYRARKRAYIKTPEERAKRTEYMRKWREENRERHNELARQSHQRNKHKHVARNRDYHLRRKYGVGHAEYMVMERAQKGACAICQTRDRGRWKYFHVDHSHKTGKVRGLLCVRCNTSLGWLELHGARARAYLER